jgi:hypothetical protein
MYSLAVMYSFAIVFCWFRIEPAGFSTDFRASVIACCSCVPHVLGNRLLWRPIDGRTYRRANFTELHKLQGFASIARR